MEKIKGQLESYKEQPFSLVLRFLMWIATFLTVGITVCIVGYILIRGIPNLSPEMFAWEYNTENVSMMPAIINTVLMVLLVLLIAVPVGIGRVVGETAALMYTAGTIAKVPGLMSSGRTLAVHMYALLSEGLYMKQAYATAVVLLVVVLLINAGSGWIAKKLTKR